MTDFPDAVHRYVETAMRAHAANFEVALTELAQQAYDDLGPFVGRQVDAAPGVKVTADAMPGWRLYQTVTTDGIHVEPLTAPVRLFARPIRKWHLGDWRQWNAIRKVIL